MNIKKSFYPILYVDDEKDNLTVFYSTFRRHYNIYLASSGWEAMEMMRNHEIQLIITDQRMPEMTGIQFLEKIIPDYPECIRMILTGFSDIEAIIQAINKGQVYRYITKPWNKEELKISIDKGLETFHLKEQNRKLIENLKASNQTLEKKVFERTREIETKNREITYNIQYASKIQNALLPPPEDMERLLPSFFLLNKPRDIVSGDYYWLAQKDNKVIIAVADCTGHGVSGAFMSILGITILNEIVNKTSVIRTDEILNQIRRQIMKSLHQTGKLNEPTDGMEMALCVIDFGIMKLQYSGAFLPLYIIHNNKLTQLKGDFMPIGIYHDHEDPFTNKEILFEKNDIIYLSTDGFVDQIGGPDRKTLRSEYFKNILININQKPMDEQRTILENTFEEWRGHVEQIDDILILGIRI